MAEQHVKLLQGLNMDQATIDKLENMTPEELKTWDPTETTGLVKSAMKNTFLNDADFLNSIPEDKVPEGTRKKIESGQYARFQNEILETAKKQLGLEDTDLADMTEEEKRSIKKTVQKVAEKYLSKKGNVAGLQDMQKQLQEVTAKLEGKDADWQTKLDTELNKVNGAASSRIVKALAKVELAGLTDIDLGVPVGYITDPLLAKLQNKYTIVLNDNEELEIKQKANPALDVLVDNKKLTFSQAMKAQVLEDKLGTVKKENEPEPAPDKRKKVVIGGDEDEQEKDTVPDFINSKIQDKIKAEEKD